MEDRILNAVRPGYHVIRANNVYRYTFTEKDCPNMLTIDGKKVEPGDYMLATIEVLIPIRPQS